MLYLNIAFQQMDASTKLHIEIICKYLLRIDISSGISIRLPTAYDVDALVLLPCEPLDEGFFLIKFGSLVTVAHLVGLSIDYTVARKRQEIFAHLHRRLGLPVIYPTHRFTHYRDIFIVLWIISSIGKAKKQCQHSCHHHYSRLHNRYYCFVRILSTPPFSISKFFITLTLGATTVTVAPLFILPPIIITSLALKVTSDSLSKVVPSQIISE